MKCESKHEMIISSRMSLLMDDKNSNLPQISNKRHTTETCTSQTKWQAKSNKSLGNELKIINMAENLKTPDINNKNENYKSMDRRNNQNRSQSQSYVSEKSGLSIAKENKVVEPSASELKSEQQMMLKGESRLHPSKELSPIKPPIQHKYQYETLLPDTQNQILDMSEQAACDSSSYQKVRNIRYFNKQSHESASKAKQEKIKLIENALVRERDLLREWAKRHSNKQASTEQAKNYMHQTIQGNYHQSGMKP